MPSVMTAGFLRDETSRALVVIGLVEGEFTPLGQDQLLGQDELLYSGGTAA